MTKASKEMILVYQDSYKTEYKQYNTDVAEVRKYFVLDEYVKVFLSRDEIPPDVFSKIGNEDVPYLERERYSILIQIEKKEIEYLSIWKLTQDGILIFSCNYENWSIDYFEKLVLKTMPQFQILKETPKIPLDFEKPGEEPLLKIVFLQRK
jgi:hypothetical protein